MTTEDVLRVATGITLSIHGTRLKLAAISRLLGIRHTAGFEKGDRYYSKQKVGRRIVTTERERTSGVWHFCTVEYTTSQCIIDHAKLFLSLFSKCKGAIKRLIVSEEFYVSLHIWNIGYSFYMPAPLMGELTCYAEDVSVVCWDNAEVEDNIDSAN